METKTISYLNSRAWYRLIKVFFISFFIIAVVISLITIYFANEPNQGTDYRVTCNYGNKTNFMLGRDKGIYLWDADSTKWTDGERNQIIQACGISNVDILNTIVPLNSGLHPLPLYSISTVVFIVTVAKIIGYSLLAILMIAFIFEVLKWAFYYIVLGSLRPKK
jgi:hypothetical protein